METSPLVAGEEIQMDAVPGPKTLNQSQVDHRRIPSVQGISTLPTIQDAPQGVCN